MKTLSPMDLRRSLGRILDEASAGERILIERDHKPLAVLVSVEDAARLDEDPAQAQRRRAAAVQALEEWRERAVVASVGPDAAERPAVEQIRDDRDHGHTSDRMSRHDVREVDR